MRQIIYILFFIPYLIFAQTDPRGSAKSYPEINIRVYHYTNINVRTNLFPAGAELIGVPLDDLVFYWNKNIRESDSLLFNAITNDYDTNVKLLNFSGNLSDEYISTKSLSQLVFYGDTIPVTCLFSNYNYADTLYFKISNNSINADSTELLPQRLTDIAYYSSSKTGADSTALASFFNVEQKGVNIREVGAGKTYATIGAAQSAASSGDSIYVYSGRYEEDVVVLENTFAVGDVEVIAQTTSALIVISNKIVKRISANGNNKSKSAYQTAQTGVTYDNCYLYNANDYNFQIIGGSDITLNNCVFNASNTEINNFWTNNDLYINECYVAGTTTGKGFEFAGGTSEKTILYSTITTQTASGQAYIFDIGTGGDYIIKFNEFKSPFIERLIIVDNTAFTGDMIFKGNLFDCDSVVNSYIRLSNTTQEFTLTITDNIFNIPTDISTAAIQIPSARDITITGNIIISTAPNSANGIVVQDIQNNYTCYVANNQIDLHSDGVQVSIGSESMLKPNLDGTIVENNLIRGSRFFDRTISSSAHGIFMAGIKDDTVRFNRVEGCNIATVHKSIGVNQNGALVQSNLYVNNTNNLLSKGVNGVQYYNNTIVRTDYYDGLDLSFQGLYLQDNLGGDPSDSTIFKNNIIVDLGESLTSGHCIWIEDTSLDSLDSDYNVIYSLNNKIAKLLGLDKNWSEWQGLGYDINSYNTDPNLNSTGYYTETPTDADGNGIDLGASYEDILLNTSIWPDGIIIGTQDVTWDIGCFKID